MILLCALFCKEFAKLGFFPTYVCRLSKRWFNWISKHFHQYTYFIFICSSVIPNFQFFLLWVFFLDRQEKRKTSDIKGWLICWVDVHKGLSSYFTWLSLYTFREKALRSEQKHLICEININEYTCKMKLQIKI